jgi:hypothetical protein
VRVYADRCGIDAVAVRLIFGTRNTRKKAKNTKRAVREFLKANLSGKTSMVSLSNHAFKSESAPFDRLRVLVDIAKMI